MLEDGLNVKPVRFPCISKFARKLLKLLSLHHGIFLFVCFTFYEVLKECLSRHYCQNS